MELNSIKKGRYDRQPVITGVLKVGRCGTFFLLGQIKQSCSTYGRAGGKGGKPAACLFDISALPMYSERAIMNY